MLAVVDYGVGNLGSILNMLKKAGEKAVLTGDPAQVAQASRIILPGVGAFDYGMEKLHESGLVEVLNHKAQVEKVPVLGICLGMQLMAEGSEEGQAQGLGWFRARCVRFQFDPANPAHSRMRIPHMGWNDIRITQPGGVFQDMYPDPRFYFVHSYHLRCDDPADIAATAAYGYEFPCALHRGNLTGVQFHPEKSHKFGLRLLKQFAAAAWPVSE